MNAGEPVEGHPGFVHSNLDFALPDGDMVLGYTIQLKVMSVEGRVGIITLQKDVNDAEAAGMVRAHQISLDKDLSDGMYDPRE